VTPIGRSGGERLGQVVEHRCTARQSRGVGGGLARNTGEQLFHPDRFRAREFRVLAIDGVHDLADGPQRRVAIDNNKCIIAALSSAAN
jgi:hypothetical protein